MNPSKIFDMLDRAHVLYDVRVSPRAVPYAAFQWPGAAEDADSATALTVIVEEGVIRITAHRIATTTATLQERVAELPIGAGFVSPDDGSVELSIGLLLGEHELTPDAMRNLLSYVDLCRRYLESAGPPPGLPELSDNREYRGQRIVSAFQRYGHDVQTVENGGTFSVRLDDPAERQIHITVTGEAGGWVHAVARPGSPVSVDLDTHFGLFQRLQRWATSGRFLLDEGQQLTADVRTPVFVAGNDRAIVWTASQAVVLLRTALRHLVRN